MIAAMVGAMRVGLLPRWMGVLGIFTGVLIFLPIGGATLEVVPAFWLVMMGISVPSAGRAAIRRPGPRGKRVRGPPGLISALPLRPATGKVLDGGRADVGAGAGAAWRQRLLAQAPAQARRAQRRRTAAAVALCREMSELWS